MLGVDDDAGIHDADIMRADVVPSIAGGGGLLRCVACVGGIVGIIVVVVVGIGIGIGFGWGSDTGFGSGFVCGSGCGSGIGKGIGSRWCCGWRPGRKWFSSSCSPAGNRTTGRHEAARL